MSRPTTPSRQRSVSENFIHLAASQQQQQYGGNSGAQGPISMSNPPPPPPPPMPSVPTTPRRAQNGPQSYIETTVGALPIGNDAGLASSIKSSRVKVAVRIRPPFQEEIDAHNQRSGHDERLGVFSPVVDARADYSEELGGKVGKISLRIASNKQREFWFDHAFGPAASQDLVYDKVVRPIVNDVLRGFNGTVFAYGQTGTGKTYTMGILEAVRDEHAGIIPRSVSQIFDYVLEHQHTTEIVVAMSFLQLYRETIQDLLAPASPGQTVGHEADNLAIREDPSIGFYVEGLQTYIARSYEEAEALINLGLENRAMAPTLMNTTSSRSHTVLTINIEQRPLPGAVPAYASNTGDVTNGMAMTPANRRAAQFRTLRSKLLLVDLAGSERVRKTISKGTRLDEAKSINTSLSALGNVIAALAESNTSHVPYRDSKLTKILHDSLGGTASTALIAAVGPAPSNYAETLSTLLFATRCMAVKTTPVQHSNIDYPELCAQLQEQLNRMEGETARRLNDQAEMYEQTIRQLHGQLDDQQNMSSRPMERVASRPSAARPLIDNYGESSVTKGAAPNASASASSGSNATTTALSPISSQIASGHTGSVHFLRMLEFIEAQSSAKAQDSGSRNDKITALMNMWRSIYDKSSNNKGSDEQLTIRCLVALLGYCYDVLLATHTECVALLNANSDRERARWESLSKDFAAEAELDRQREAEVNAMMKLDPMRALPGFEEVGSHLAALPRVEALSRIQSRYKSNNEASEGSKNAGTEKSIHSRREQSVIDRIFNIPVSSVDPVDVNVAKGLMEFTSPIDFVEQLGALHAAVERNIGSLGILMSRKDFHYKDLKKELMAQMLEKRKREEEVLNWSYILKHLLGTSTELRRQLQQERLLDERAGPHTAGKLQQLRLHNTPSTAPSGGSGSSSSSIGGASVNTGLGQSSLPRYSSAATPPLSRVLGRGTSAVVSTPSVGLGIMTGLSEAGPSSSNVDALMGPPSKLARRLGHDKQLLSHNKKVADEIDHIGPPARASRTHESSIGNANPSSSEVNNGHRIETPTARRGRSISEGAVGGERRSNSNANGGYFSPELTSGLSPSRPVKGGRESGHSSGVTSVIPSGIDREGRTITPKRSSTGRISLGSYRSGGSGQSGGDKGGLASARGRSASRERPGADGDALYSPGSASSGLDDRDGDEYMYDDVDADWSIGNSSLPTNGSMRLMPLAGGGGNPRGHSNQPGQTVMGSGISGGGARGSGPGRVRDRFAPTSSMLDDDAEFDVEVFYDEDDDAHRHAVGGQKGTNVPTAIGDTGIGLSRKRIGIGISPSAAASSGVAARRGVSIGSGNSGGSSSNNINSSGSGIIVMQSRSRSQPPQSTRATTPSKSTAGTMHRPSDSGVGPAQLTSTSRGTAIQNKATGNGSTESIGSRASAISGLTASTHPSVLNGNDAYTNSQINAGKYNTDQRFSGGSSLGATHSSGGGVSQAVAVNKPEASTFARQVVASLDVGSAEEAAALEVIDRVSRMTPEQLARLDPTTRAEVLEMRRQLGIHAKNAPYGGPSNGGGRGAGYSQADDDDDFSQI